MFPQLVLQFLGLPQVHLDSEPVVLDRRKAIALLAYLAVNDIGHPRQEYARESLSGLLWPDYEQGKAFSNLRRTIWEVHQAIGEDWLIASRESVRLNPDVEIDLDVARFQDLLSQAHQQTDISIRIALLVDAVKLYRNHFLTGFSLKDAYPFNEWAFSQSEDLRRQLTEALTLLSEDYCALGQADKAIPYSRRLVSLDPLNESAHRQLMNVYMLAGQHAAAMKQYQSCEQILRREMNLDPQPETRALYKKIRKAGMERVHIEKPIEIITPKHNLPAQISSFIGREKEQDEIVNLLSKHRLVTLAGVGGIGKTRLVLQVSQKILHDFPDGVWFIPLDSLSNPVLVPQTIASVFDIRESPEELVLEILKNVLREKTALLVLDNCEHLLEACAGSVKVLLMNCPNLKIFTTSRELLKMEGEAAYYISSLSLPELDNTSLEILTECEAVQLFIERATLALSSFTLKTENARFVVDICHRVDGIPLAIELAAAQVNILQVEEILKQLQDSFHLLASDGQTVLPRHQTMQASMDWSWGLLSEEEQTFLRQLSVFAGGWNPESASAVCDGDFLRLTRALVKKSLILVEQEMGRETRYRFHEIVRQYARQRLIESGEEKRTRTRHLQYFLRFSEQAELALKGPAQTQWHVRLNDERDNLRVALEWADRTDLEAGLYLSGNLQSFWLSLDLSEGMPWLVKFLDQPQSKNYPQARAKALCTYSMLLFSAGKFDLSDEAARECLDLYRACGDKFGEIDGLLRLATSHFFNWNSESIAFWQQALDLSKSLGDQWRQAWVLTHFPWQGDDFSRRISSMREAVALFKKVGDIEAATVYISELAYLELLNGNPQTAQKLLKQAVQESRNATKTGTNREVSNLDGIVAFSQSLKNKSWLASVLQTYGRIAFSCGDFEDAYSGLQKSIETSQEFGDRLSYFWSRTFLGYLLLQRGDVTEARDVFVDTAQSFQTDKNVIGVVFSLEGMASLYVVINQHLYAARLIGWADAMRENIEDRRPVLEQADVDKIIAACLAKMGEVAFSDAYDEGGKMSLDEAVAFALA